MYAAYHALKVLIKLADLTNKISSVHTGQLNVHDHNACQARNVRYSFLS